MWMSHFEFNKALDEQLAAYPSKVIAQGYGNTIVHSEPGTYETPNPEPLSSDEILQLRQDAAAAGVMLPESDLELQDYVRGYHAEAYTED